MVDVIEAVERGLRKAESLGASEAEVYVVKESSTTIKASFKGVESIEGGESITAYVRVLIGKRLSIQGSMISRLEDIDSLVERAIKIAKSSPEDPQWISLPRKLGSTPVYDIVDERVKNPDIDFYTSMLKTGTEMPREIDRRVFTNSSYVYISTVVRAIGNSYQRPVSAESTYFSFGIEVKAVDSGYESSFYNHYSAPTLKEFDMRRVVEYATRVAVETLKAKPVDTGVYQAVLTPQVFSAILSALIVPAIRADMVQKKRSPLANKLFTEVLSQQITLIDDGAVPNMVRSSPFDDEGVETKRKTVFDRGVLRTYLYDTYTANIDGKESTGNARRVGASNTYPDATNILVLPGTSSIDSILRDIRRGIVVHGTIGEWLSNPVSGYMNATVTHGFLVVNGEIKQAVKGVVIAGDIYKLLKDNLIAISKEYEVVDNYIVPFVAMDNVSVAGG